MDFDHWLKFSDIFKRAIDSKPDVAWDWSIQWARMTSKHGENDRYRRIVRVQEVDMKVLQITENPSSPLARLINDLLRIVAVSEKLSKTAGE